MQSNWPRPLLGSWSHCGILGSRSAGLTGSASIDRLSRDLDVRIVQLNVRSVARRMRRGIRPCSDKNSRGIFNALLL